MQVDVGWKSAPCYERAGGGGGGRAAGAERSGAERSGAARCQRTPEPGLWRVRDKALGSKPTAAISYDVYRPLYTEHRKKVSLWLKNEMFPTQKKTLHGATTRIGYWNTRNDSIRIRKCWVCLATGDSKLLIVWRARPEHISEFGQILSDRELSFEYDLRKYVDYESGPHLHDGVFSF